MFKEYAFKILSVQGNTLKIELDEDLNLSSVITLADQKKASGRLIFDDKRHITSQQRKLIFALINDLIEYTGDYGLTELWEDRFKRETMSCFNLEHFSLSDCSISTANLMILVILNFLFEEEIPFKLKWWHELPSDFPRQMLALKNKQCVICGKNNADIAHYKTIGAGRNRKKVNQVGMYIMTLCRVHHTEQHKIGIRTFLGKYHLRPIKITPEIAKKYNLGGKNYD